MPRLAYQLRIRGRVRFAPIPVPCLHRILKEEAQWYAQDTC